MTGNLNGQHIVGPMALTGTDTVHQMQNLGPEVHMVTEAGPLLKFSLYISMAIEIFIYYTWAPCVDVHVQ